MNPLIRVLAAAATAVPALAVLGGTAAADTSWQQTVPIVGASFACDGVSLTATAGTITFAYHFTTASDGSSRDNGRGTAHHAMLEDESDNPFRLVGGFTYTDTYDPTTGATIAGTGVDNFTIVNAEGGLIGRVGVVVHLDRDGSVRDVQFGDCTDNNS